ncbi:M13 family metallopeptidase [Novosphingobium mangrovi (ex Huang et al. 2023)]|uniref:M13 family peptidase n=1 Tax=Novosphingobium mangrovi (ex Huang et al. 2023) TaxID=2976432 RepID=A0ABT2HZI0_9SPHN|nr:M13-type metalloendopeptidase [Novosphingobium mangrovi (ex Huang et al. 2023)]MCT2397959.1 M13 family peptidase [Novosphingobium mangrovi (ex Huang et al. 2023)]
MRKFLGRALAVSSSVSAIVFSLSANPAAADDGALAPSSDWGAFGVQTQWMDTGTKPGDDFDEYVNGKWLASVELPADRTSWGSFIELRELSEQRLHAIMDGLLASSPAPGTDAARVAAAYKAFMDTDAIDKAGLAPVRPYLDKIFAARAPVDIVRLFGEPGFASPVVLWVDADSKRSDTYALHANIGGLGLPDRNYYLKQDERSKDIRAKYLSYLGFLLGKAGYADPDSAARAVLSLETRIAQADWDRAGARNPDLTYNKLSVADFEGLGSPGLVKTFLDTVGAAKADYVIVGEMPPTPEELKEANIDAATAETLFGGGMPVVAKLLDTVPVATWQAYLAARFLSDHAAVLPSDIDTTSFDFYGKGLSGQPEQRARWKRGISAVESGAGELLGKIYAEKYYPPEQKAAMTQLVANLRKAMAENLKDLKWMGPETREEAKAKLDAFTPKIGAPNTFKEYEGLTFSPTDPLGNMIGAGAWQTNFDMNRIGKTVDRGEWGMLPETVNAYYNSTMNEIVFPAAILQPPFFNLTADPAVNYGGIGAVIGHEMSHGFDDQGSKSDGTGNLRNWWTPADKAAFEKLQDKLGAQYDAFCPFDDGKTCVNGKLTMGENIGDLGGLSLAYRAYRLSLDGKEAPVIGGFTGDQRFFMAWAQVWRSKVREAQARKYLIIDPHSPPHYRIDGIVRNFDEWYKAFDVKPGDKLYLPPAQRVRIW